MAIDVQPLNAGVGAEVRGLDISRPLDAATLKELRAAWLEYCVLLFRGQSLSDDQLLAFTRQFGDLEFPPTKLLGLKNRIDQKEDVPPEINVISNVKEHGVPIGQLGAGEAAWHSDSAFVEVPPAASILYAIEIPPEGGNTSFLNMYSAWETLPDDLKQAVRGRSAKHDFTYTSAGERRKDYDEVTDPSKAPGPTHPIVRTHPESGRECLYLGRRLNCYIVGLPVPESEALLDRIWRHVTNPAFTYEHVWRKGDVLMWDNRCTMHKREAFDDNQRRIMHRAQLKGDKPYYQASAA
jgi:taurine dioxygenase